MKIFLRKNSWTILLFCLFIGSVCACQSGGKINEPVFEWDIQDSGTAASIRGLCAVSDEVCWIGGSGGTFAVTSDGGATWTVRRIAEYENMDFRDVQAFDARSALVLSAGRPGVVLKTEDGGESWREVYSNSREGVFFNSMAFWDEKRGMAVGDPLDGRFLMIRTEDGGDSWEEISPENRPEAREGEAGFAASGTCLAVHHGGFAWFGTGGTAARVGRSTDFGRTWTMAETPQIHGQSSQGIFSLAFRDGRNGVLVGGDYQNPELKDHITAVTSDGGETWEDAPPESGGLGGYRSCVAFIPGTESACIAMGKDGADYSIDGGRSWKPIRLEGYYYCLSLSSQGRTGWAAGSEGRVARLSIRFP